MKIALVLVVVTLAFGGLGDALSRISNKDLTDFSEELLKKDVNNAAHYIHINYQGHTYSGNHKDEAPHPLLKVNSKAYQIPTISRLRMLHDNYIHDTGINEQVTPQERTEENNFLDAVMVTPVMKHTMKFLADKGCIKRDDFKAQKDLLRRIWFNMYSRGGGKVGSSAFEHIFLGEMKRGEVSGLHNWVYFATEEGRRNANYMGYIRKLDFGGKGAILKLHFKWGNAIKPVDSMFVGTSPELEMALYTVCFILHRDERCHLQMAGKRFSIKTHTFHYRGKNMIGSAFPEI